MLAATIPPPTIPAPIIPVLIIEESFRHEPICFSPFLSQSSGCPARARTLQITPRGSYLSRRSPRFSLGGPRRREAIPRGGAFLRGPGDLPARCPLLGSSHG